MERMMSWVTWVRGYRPSRRSLALTTTGVGLYSLYRYDRLEAKRIQDGFLAEARAIGDEPLAVDAFTPRALLYVSPGPLMFRYALAFTDYVRPIWMAAGMRAEVIEHRYHQDLYHHLVQQREAAARLRDAREALLARRAAAAAQLGRDWLFRKQTLPPLTPEEETLLQSTASPEEMAWDKEVRLVTMGRSAFRTTLRALQTDQDGSHNDNNDEDNEDENEDAKAENDMLLPPLGFVPYTPRTWLWRMLRFFNTREDAYVLGKAALVVAKDRQMNMARVFGGVLALEAETLQPRKDAEGSESAEQPSYHLDEPAVITARTLQRIPFLQEQQFVEEE